MNPLMKIMILTVFIFLAACGENEVPKSETSILKNTPIHNETNAGANETNHDEINLIDDNIPIDDKTETLSNFESGILFDLATYEDQLSEQIFELFGTNLNALLEYDQVAYFSVFVNENASEGSKYYYSEDYKYQFTEIESIIPIEQYRIDITVLGNCLDTTTNTIKDVKMVYSFCKTKEGEWFLYVID